MATDDIESREDGDIVNTYTLTLDPNGGYIEHKHQDTYRYTTEPMTKQVQIGKTVPDIENVSIIRPGYSFEGWVKLDPGFWDKMSAYPYKQLTELTSTTIWKWNHNTTFLAKWIPETAIIKWVANGGSWANGVIKEKTTSTEYGVVIGSLDQFKDQPTMIGQTFVGWFTHPERGTQITEYSQVEGSKAYYAHWQDKYCTITFKDEKDKVIETFSVKYGYVLTFKSRSKRGYDFKGWVANGVTYSTDDTLVVVDDVTFQETFDIIEYTITYDLKGEGRLPDGYWEYYTINSDEYELPTPTRTGYDFNGWRLNGKTVTTIPAGSIGNRTFVSKGWTPIQYTITFDSCGGIPSETTIDIHFDEKIQLPEDPVKPESDSEEYTFIGWFTADGSEIVNGSRYTTPNNSTYYAHWDSTTIKYEIEYKENGATDGYMENSIHKNGIEKPLSKNNYIKEYTITYVDIKATPDEDTRENRDLKFLGWSETTDGEVKYQDQQVVVDVVEKGEGGIKPLYAIWEKSTTAILNNPYHEGYNLDGWYTTNTYSEKKGDPGDEITLTDNIILYAKWTPQTRMVIFNAMGGMSTQPILTVEYDKPIENLPIATRDGYAFLGWFTQPENGDQITSDTRITLNTTYYAHWEINTTTITFNGNGGFV